MGLIQDAEANLNAEYVQTLDGVTYSTRTEFAEPFEYAENQFSLVGQINVGKPIMNTGMQWEVSIGYISGQGVLQNDKATLIFFDENITSETRSIFLKTALLW